MPYPLVIFGAGASYDFLKISRHDAGEQYNLNTWKPPLTNGIFDVSRFSQIIGKYEDVKPLASTIINITDSEDPFDFEAYLSEQENLFPEKSYPQIIALRFYLAELLSKVSFYFYRHTNNHRHLLDQIDKRIGKALIVNFNYDTLLEKNIKDINFSNKIDSYIAGNIKVIKIHGAHNWRYSPKIDTDKKNVYEYFVSGGKTLNEEYKSHEVDQNIFPGPAYDKVDFNLSDFRRHKENQFEGYFEYYLPAIAIPIASKADSVCPSSHITILKEELSKVDRILVIGWRAQDQYLIGLLKECLKGKVKLHVVSSNEMSANEAALKFKDIPQILFDEMVISKNDGYTNFMIRREYELFLN